MYINVSVNIGLCWLCLSTSEPLLLCPAKLYCLLYSAQDHHFTMSFILCGFGCFVFPALLIFCSVWQALKYGRFSLFYSLPVLNECDFLFSCLRSLLSHYNRLCAIEKTSPQLFKLNIFMNRKKFSWVRHETEGLHNTLLTIMSSTPHIK